MVGCVHSIPVRYETIYNKNYQKVGQQERRIYHNYEEVVIKDDYGRITNKYYIRGYK